MAFMENLKEYLRKSFLLGWKLADRPRVFYYHLKPFLSKTGLVRFSNRLLCLDVKGEPLYFRDNWGDVRSISSVFENDYDIEDCRVFVDVGSNNGLIARHVRMSSPSCRLFCFEPLKIAAAICQLNNPDATVVSAAVGSKPGSIEMLVDQDSIMASRISYDYKQKKMSFDVITLDGFFGDLPDRIDVMKIDVEGAEVDVIKGAKKTLSRTSKVIAEIHSDDLLTEFSRTMSGYGFIENSKKKINDGLFIVVWSNPSSEAVKP